MVSSTAASAPRIEISARPEGTQWKVAVQDNGIGIAPKYQQKIFGLFKRLHGRDIPGNGIGLALCQKIVERHGGRIWVESEPGRGATFFVLLRQAPEPATVAGPPAETALEPDP